MPDLTLAYSTVQLISYIHLSTFSDGRTTIGSHGSLGYEPRKEEVKVLFGQSLFFSLQVEFPEVHGISSEVRWFIPNPQQHKLQKWKAGEENYKFKSCNLSFDPRSWLVNDVFLCRKQTPQHHQATICAKITESACPLRVLGSQT